MSRTAYWASATGIRFSVCCYVNGPNCSIPYNNCRFPGPVHSVTEASCESLGKCHLSERWRECLCGSYQLGYRESYVDNAGRNRSKGPRRLGSTGEPGGN